MGDFFISELRIDNLWDYRDIKLAFNRDLNILIGPNASGKTTILNMLHNILEPSPILLRRIPFNKATVKLRSFSGNETRTVKVFTTESGFRFVVSGKPYTIDTLERYHRRSVRYLTPRLREKRVELFQALGGLVPAVWLPVSRRLPVAEEEEEEERIYRGKRYQESVDVCLGKLIIGLTRYRLGLDAKLSERYKEFQKRVLALMLYSKTHDRVTSASLKPPTDSDKKQLLKAFKTAGLLDATMEKRIDGHFDEAKESWRRLRPPSRGVKRDRPQVGLGDIFIIPLIGRTREMVKYARELEDFRSELFQPLAEYETIANSFLHGKQVHVDDKGELRIESSVAAMKEIDTTLLSSGEKQVLILLTQALLWEDKPVVYVADEPELSLHVSWQAKLLQSLIALSGKSQMIVATHSPDIVGGFVDKVIDLGKLP